MKKCLLFSLIISITFIFTGCEQFGFKSKGIEYSDGLIEVRGKNTLSETLVIPPGTTLRFVDYKPNSLEKLIFGSDDEISEIIGNIIANGTINEPILIESIAESGCYITGSIELNYCEIKRMIIDGAINASYSKLQNSCFQICGSTSNIRYNTFNNSYISLGKIHIYVYEWGYGVIEYNILNNNVSGITICGAVDTVIRNNIDF